MSAYLERFGVIVREELAIPEREFTDSSLKLNVLAESDVAIRRQRLRRRLMATSAALVVCAGGLAASYLHRTPSGEKPIEYRVAGSAMPAPIGKYVAPLPKQPLALRFSEGSVVELEPGARARVARTTTHGATVLIETGGANVNVVHRPATDWTILAGPYTVHVTGTAFNLDFEASSQRFELKMQSGVVSVEGPGLSHPVEVRRDQKFVHYVGDPNFERRESDDAADSVPAKEAAGTATSDMNPSDVSPTDSTVLRKANAATGDNSTTKESSRSGWAADVARGEYAAVLRKAKEKGWTQVLEESNTADLMAVANAARFLGRTDSSREALDALRRRFKGTFAAQSATYLLGRLVEPTSSKEAVSWYLQYEREAPNGPLVAEAAGRRLLLLQAAGDRSGTERLAREYVSRFPDGPYAGVARKIVLP
jgi:hypothetical protein